ncbi:CBS domain-containing protein [Bremerella cremea]|nr:CBS domain-containing protein [Bremerella cremea]
MVARALRIVVVSEDRQYLRNGYDFFVACGYEVETQCDTIYRETDRFHKNDLLIYDYVANQATSHHSLYKIAVVSANRPDHVRQAISEGADDVVVRPVTPAKLLVRIRAAAAILEARIAISQQFGRDVRNRYPGEGAFLGTLQQTIEQISIHGHYVCATMFATATEDPQRYQTWLQDLATTALPNSRIFELSGKRVAVVTPATAPEQVSDWAAERLASASVTDTTSTEQAVLRVSGSFVTTRNEGTSSEQMALVLNDRLNLALSLGEGLLIDEPHENQWLSQQPTGSIFDGMTARDIMRPTTIELPDNEPVGSALEKMRLWNADIAPVLTSDGEPCGLIRVDDLVEVEDPNQPIRQHCLPNVPKVSWDANFEEFVALFSSNDSSWLEVLQDSHPVGVIHCDDLTSMNTPVMVSLP